MQVVDSKDLKIYARQTPRYSNSENATTLCTQIRTALIVMLLVMILHIRSCFGWHLSNFRVLLSQQLYVCRDLWKWIDSYFQAPETAHPLQRALAFG